MISQPSHSTSFLKRFIKRLGLDSKEDHYFFRIPNMKSAKGSLIALAAVFMLVVAVMIPVAMTLLKNVRINTNLAQLYVAGAQNAARAGLEDTLGYFVRQGTILRAFTSQVIVPAVPTFAPGMSYVDQPFNPQYSANNPQNSDTFQETTQLAGAMTFPFNGLCNEYPIDAATNTIVAAGSTQTTSVYFGRYEVQRQPAGALIPGAVHDISGNRQANYLNGDGLTWAITSTGYIYKRMNYSLDQYGEYLVPYNVYPNKVLATAKAYSEFRKLTVNLPVGNGNGDAAVYCSVATNVNVNGSCYLGGVVANGYGLCAMSGAATTPTGGTANNFFGGGYSYNNASATANAPISDVNVFGMSLKDIQFIADYVGSSSSALSIVSANKLAYFNGNLTYGPNIAGYQSLNSTGILVVNGNLTLQQGGSSTLTAKQVPSSYYSGIIFVTGNMTINQGCIVDGVVIMGYSSGAAAGGLLTLAGGSLGNYSYLTADPQAVNKVLQQVAQYREDISARRTLLAFPGI